MKTIEIQSLPNEAHRNQSGVNICPDGWAIIPDGMTIPDTFPFVSLEVDEQTVTSMTAGTIPTPDPMPIEPDAITQTQLALAELAETEVTHDLENKLALAELADMIGGTNG